MKKQRWTLDQMKGQHGRIAVVTGANSGLGYYSSRAFALKGARVIMACRNLEKGALAKTRIMNEGAVVEPELQHLDLASLESVRHFAGEISGQIEGLDLLINNAGLMAVPYARTEDGFEMQFGVNHLGHFALTALLWPLLSGTAGSRVVQVSSLAHYFGRIRFEDLNWEKSYSRWGAYGMSKLANLLFIRELSRRMSEKEQSVTVAAAHPGYADTELQPKAYGMNGKSLRAGSFRLVNRLVAQPAAMGALPVLYAATADSVKSGNYYGPGGLLRLRGYPVHEKPKEKKLAPEVAGALWSLSERMTGLQFPVKD